MKNLKVVGSASSKEALTALINKKLYSVNWIITKDNKPFNTKLNKYLEGCFIRQKNNRWQLLKAN
jgi:hypothetical protein